MGYIQLVLISPFSHEGEIFVNLQYCCNCMLHSKFNIFKDNTQYSRYMYAILCELNNSYLK